MKYLSKFIFVLCLSWVQQANCKPPQENKVLKSAHDYISSFRAGNDFKRPLVDQDVVLDPPDQNSLQLFSNELMNADAEVREKIVDLLVFLGKRSNPKSSLVITNPQILDLLAGPALIKSDRGQGAAIRAFRKSVSRSDLSRYGSAFAKALSNTPRYDMLLLIAKSQSLEAIDIVENLANQPEWLNNDSAKIASAALGDKNLEDEYISAVENASDGEALAEALETLSLIGTPRSLKAIAEQLRTPLTVLRPGVEKRSVRTDVLNALVYHYPSQLILYPREISSDEDYAIAESFCVEHLGANYSKPRPPFMTYVPFPILR